MTTPLQSPESVLIYEFINALNQASGAASQLIHHIRHPGMIQIRDTIDLVKEGMTIHSVQSLKTTNKILVNGK